MKDYFQNELGITVHHNPIEIKIEDTVIMIGHGDGLGPGDKGYKRMKKVFKNPFFQWLYRLIHPDLGIRFGQYLSQKNKLISGEEDIKFLGEDKEWLVAYSKSKLEKKHYDYFVFGHRHLPLAIDLGKQSQYINLGDWITHFTYGVFDGKTLSLKTWNKAGKDD
jgi:UDP-2,3-diacylglucosamine hydrolase